MFGARLASDQTSTLVEGAKGKSVPASKAMETVWFITNPNSGSTSREKCDAIEALFIQHGLTLGGRTLFPDNSLPEPEALDAAGVDTVVLFAGDGTINTTLCKLANWDGAFLILPGGTMNLLAKALHAELDPAKIIESALKSNQRVALPYVEAGSHRAFVGLILGPAGHWVNAREAVRKGRFDRVVPAIRLAWRRTFGNGVRVSGAAGLRDRYQAVLISPAPGKGLDVAAIEARDWGSIAELGWDWLTGDWVAARAVTKTQADQLRVQGKRGVHALFDGEPVTLDPGVHIVSGATPPGFIVTRVETP